MSFETPIPDPAAPEPRPPRVDPKDVVFVTGILLTSVGVSLSHGIPAGLVVAGLLLIASVVGPAFARMRRPTATPRVDVRRRPRR